MPILTLLTDYGLADSYVAQLKGAALGVCPTATLVDLSHQVPPQDIEAGAFLLWTAVGAFPSGTVHLAVVDPGVGSSRRAIALRAACGHFLVGPDNGLLPRAAERLGGIEAAVELTDARYWGPAASSTFHGRDLFAPVAGHLLLGLALEALGPLLTAVKGPHAFAQPHVEAQRMVGEVLHVDHFGNLVTNLPGGRLSPGATVAIGAHRLALSSFYAAVAPGALVALVGSAGLLELSVRDGSAQRVTGAQRGTKVEVVLPPRR